MTKLPVVKDETFTNFTAERVLMNSLEQLEERLDNIEENNPCIFTMIETGMTGIGDRLRGNVDEELRIYVMVLMNWLLVDIYDILDEEAILTAFERVKNREFSKNN